MENKTFHLSSTSWIRAACPISQECDSPLCPLDPDLEQKKPSKLTPLCYWYHKLITLDETEDIPDHILNLLMRYTLYFLNLRFQGLVVLEFTRLSSKTPPPLDDLHNGKGVV